MPTADDLTDLVDNPTETLAVEYKSSIDISETASKASLARHLAALANHGGGHLVYGFNDDLSVAAATEYPAVNHDSVAGVISAYLEPPFQCDVRVVTSRSGARHTVIVVPSHGPSPVCSKRGGPQDANGRPQGILVSTYYTRKPGPKSEPITTPADWQPIIRRCALSERAAILGAIDIALKGGDSEGDFEPRLRQWHEALARGYRDRLTTVGTQGILSHGYIQFSFAIHQNGENIEYNELLRVVERCNAESDAITRMHWGPLVMIHRDPFTPRSRTDADINNGELDFVEAALIEPDSAIGTSDMWRISGDGLVSLIKNWWEDTPHFREPPQTCFSPNWLARELGGFVLFARALASTFATATAVTFRCEWTGLKGRRPFDPQARWFLSGHPSEDERRVSTATVSLAELNNSWEAHVATLAGPVARATGISHVLNAFWFTGQAQAWANGRL
ncbi:MAG: ATP-binding protein [Acidocella sp.]|nr:ATP-binding protein [Acidocella sp.]